MQSVNELLRVFMLQARLERAMKQRHGARVEEERKFGGMRQSFAAFPESMKRGVAVQNT